MNPVAPPRRLLLVDDEENIVRALRRLLHRDGYELRTATSGEEGLAVLAEFPAGVIVSDQRMPGMNGAEFLGRVKVLHPGTVRLMLSGYTDLKSVTDAINRGEVYKFLTKPWEDELLRTNIREAFEFFELRAENERLGRDLEEVNHKLARLVEEQHRRLDLQQRMLELSRDVLDQLPCPVLGIDSDGVIVLANEALYAFAGPSPAQLLGRETVGLGDGPLAEALKEGAVLIDGTRRFRVVTTALNGPAGPRGRIITLIPEPGTS